MIITPVSPRARDILSASIVWDNHGCMPMRADEELLPQLDRYSAAGATVASINIGYGLMSWADHVGMARHFRQYVLARPERYHMIATAEDVALAKATGRLGISFDVEGMLPIEHSLERVAELYELGVRWMLIAYNQDNQAGGGCMGEDGGLTPLGRAIIDEMERVGMVLCLSHSSARTVLDAIEHARNPPIFSHSNPAGATAHPRNVDDAVMRACAAKGGVIGLSGIGPFLGVSSDPVAALLRHIRYVVDLVGPEYVGLGLDFVFDRTELDDFVRANPSLFPTDLDGTIAMVPPEAIPQIAEGLIRDGLSDAEISGILGGNWLRIARACWR
ncbi:dipeptidase [Rhizorhabdus dicambivorans]|uniref:Membrane dipeptidase n=1 Tax=Rhizorhabdus dicambivorans TaxID=1850238 RepID=A0A2A4FTW8_9SPHN|nr:membrane dipeptidase [Rhizorhabdus dicambivorans]ATE65772.1 membrane dipeptidase [Rhizorhabdus dicambivorans]PCE41144.1 membrane dipeptidase [Rhizorhabdus dicambivorans]